MESVVSIEGGGLLANGPGMTMVTGYDEEFCLGDTTVVQVLDTTDTHFMLRGSPVGADTIFFDDDGDGKENRLFYTGTQLNRLNDITGEDPVQITFTNPTKLVLDLSLQTTFFLGSLTSL